MDSLIHSLECAINQKNWYAALVVAITLPDICGKVDQPIEHSGPRYKQWCETYLVPKYSFTIGMRSEGHNHCFLSASDCYALRCALLHEGSDDITEQSARESLERFHFTAPPESGTLHCNQKNEVLQLQVDRFASDIIQSIKEWLLDIEGDLDKNNRLGNLVKIYDSFTF